MIICESIPETTTKVEIVVSLTTGKARMYYRTGRRRLLAAKTKLRHGMTDEGVLRSLLLQRDINREGRNTRKYLYKTFLKRIA